MNDTALEVWRVLLVDDDEDDYLLTRSMLSQARGKKVELEWAPTFQAGQQQLQSNHYHAVLVDYDLGAQTGLELIREAAASGYTAPLILFTGRGGFEVDVEAMQAGATLYLTKGEATPLLLERSLRYAIERKRIEADLNAARAEAENEKRRLQAVMEALPVGVAITDANGGNLHSNQAFEQVWSGPRLYPQTVADYAAYQAWWVDTGKAVAPDEWASAQAVQKGKTVVGQLLEIQRFDGQRAWVLDSAAPVRDANGKVVGSAVAIQDVTSLREAEQALVQSEEKYREQNKILNGVNRILREGLTCETEEILGRTCLAVVEEVTESKLGFIGEIGRDGLLHDIAISDPGWHLCAMYDKSGHRRPPGDFAIHGLYGRVLRDGKSLLTNTPAEHPDSIGTPPGHPPLTAFLGVPLIISGRTTGIIAVGNRDGGYRQADLEALEALAPAIVEAFARKRAEETLRESNETLQGQAEELEVQTEELKIQMDELASAYERLRESEEKLRSLALFPDENPNPVMRISTDGDLLYANLPGKILLGCWEPVDEPGLRQNLLAAATEALITGTSKELDVSCKDKTFSFVFAPIANQGYVNLYGRDITERKQAEQALAQANAALLEANKRLQEQAEELEVQAEELQVQADELLTANEKLRRSEMDLARAQAVANTGNWRLDVRKDQLLWSDETYHIFGIPKGTPLTYEIFLAAVHPDDRDFVDRSWAAALRGEPYDIEHRILVGEEVKWVRERAELEFDQQGNLLGGFGIVHDITERKRSEETLRKLSRVVEQNPASVVITDIAGNIEYVNPKFTQLTGYSLEEARGKNPRILKSGRTPSGEYKQLWDTILAGGQWQGEFCNMKKNGELYWESASISPIINEKGAITHFVAVKEDITRRKRTEEALQESEEKFRSAVANAAIGFALTTPDGRFVDTNPAYCLLTGYSIEELRTLEFPQLVHPDDFVENMRLIDLMLTGQIADFVVENRYVCKGGNAVWVRKSVSMVRNIEGAPRWIIALVEDITERKRAEEALRAYTEQLKRSNQALQDFAFIASHDLQEPLRKVQAFGDLLKSRYLEEIDDQGRDYIERMQQASGRMRIMLDGLMAYSRVTTKVQPFARVDLRQVAADVLSDLEVRLMQTGGQVELGELPVIEADPLQMHQLLQNLLGNALKFHRPGVPPVVRVYAISREKGNRGGGEPQPLSTYSPTPLFPHCIQIIIEDNGIGFEMKHAGRLFQPFHRLTGKSAFEGTGMGLAICRKIVERHGGSISARSEPGMGATFVVTLPREQKEFLP